MPRSPEDAVPDALVPLVVVLAVKVGRHAGVKPPAGAVVGSAVSRGVHVIVAVGGGEELLVVVEVLVEADGISRRPTAATHQFSFYRRNSAKLCPLMQTVGGRPHLYPLIDTL